ncbi:MAG: hypothetical protein JWS12_489 [Candidatus Saccharibacteria bacterium]|nr:hypothetical protein [Candidatus Saccharibacteria bacterium]
MFNLLGQDTTYTTLPSTTHAGIGVLFGGVFLIVWLVVIVVLLASMWKLFEKAGRPGWNALIPLYNTWVLAEIVGKPGYWGLYPIAGIIPLVGWLVAVAGTIYFSIETAKVFGKEPTFAILLVILPFIGYPILGFGDAKYHAPAAPTSPAKPTTPGTAAPA